MRGKRARGGALTLLSVAAGALLLAILGGVLEKWHRERALQPVRIGKVEIIAETGRVDLSGTDTEPHISRGWTRSIPGKGRAPFDGGEFVFHRFDLSKPLTLVLSRNPEVTSITATQRIGLKLNGETLEAVDIQPASARIHIRLPAEHIRPMENRLSFHVIPDETREVSSGGQGFPGLPRLTELEIRDGTQEEQSEKPICILTSRRGARIPAGSCLHIPLRVPHRAQLHARVDSVTRTIPATEQSFALFAREVGSEIRPIQFSADEGGRRFWFEKDYSLLEGLQPSFSADLSEFEGKLVDLYLVSPPSLAVTFEDLEIAGMGSCPEEDLNILLVVIDTLRSDHLSCGGESHAKTPVIDRLAREGVRFARAFTHIPVTGPSHTTLFTSRYASEAGVRNNGQALPYEEFCLAEALQYTGRSTFGFISMTVLGKSFHFDQGFEIYRDELPPPWMLGAREVNTRVEEELLNRPREPFFAFVHYCDPHEPYSSHGLSECWVMARRGDEWLAEADIDKEIGLSFRTVLSPGVNPIRFSSEKEFRLRGCVVEPRPNGLRQIPGSGWKRDGRGILSTRDAELAFHVPGEETTEVTLHAVFSEILSETESRRNYAREVEAVDTALGELLERLESTGLLERTLVILTSDHGESLGEHGHMGHVEQLYDPLMAVPLILRFPDGRHAGRTVEDLVALSDIPPTVFDLLDIAPPSKTRGMSLLPLIEGKEKREGRALFFETYRPEAREDKVGIRTPFRKLIRTLGAETEEVYDLQNDPRELANIVDKDPLTTEQLRILLAELFGGGAAGPEAPTPQESFLDEDAKEALKALGYFR